MINLTIERQINQQGQGQGVGGNSMAMRLDDIEKSQYLRKTIKKK